MVKLNQNPDPEKKEPEIEPVKPIKPFIPKPEIPDPEPYRPEKTQDPEIHPSPLPEVTPEKNES